MSYDLYLGEHYYNYTWNMSQFFHDFIKDTSRDKTGLDSLVGLSGHQASRILREAIEDIQRASFKRDTGVPTWKFLGDKYDPKNYWGDVMSATMFLMTLYFVSQENPTLVWQKEYLTHTLTGEEKLGALVEALKRIDEEVEGVPVLDAKQMQQIAHKVLILVGIK